MGTNIHGISDKVLLVILDGFGINKTNFKNAVADANTPNLDNLFENYPFTTIEAGGVAVGLPKGVVGNSEVGHMNLGAGRPVRQDLVRINEAIQNNTLKDMPRLNELIDNAKKTTKRIHLMGLLSDGGVHSHIDHLKEIQRILNDHEELEVFFHAFMDGRDTQEDIGEKYLSEMESAAGFKLASMQGRSIGMDRDRRWDKIELAYKTFIGRGNIREDVTAKDYLKEQYEKGIYDEFVEPVLFNKDWAIREADSIFFINFRPDRAIELALCFNWNEFSEFSVPVKPSYYLCMTPYVPDEVELPILFDKEKIEGVLTDYLSKKGKKQLKIAETEKYAHVTFFFNGGEKKTFPGEEHILVPSPRDVSTYDQKPQMSAFEVTEKLEKALREDFDFILVNFANCDMVGHTGKYEAAIKAVETVDKCVGRLMKTCEKNGVAMLLTADHGNSDQMVYENGKPHTSHTGSPVPFSVFHKSLKGIKLEPTHKENALKDISPTIIHIMGEKMPELFTGHSIFS